MQDIELASSRPPLIQRLGPPRVLVQLTFNGLRNANVHDRDTRIHLTLPVATDGFQKMVGGFANNDPLQVYTSVMVPIVLAVPGFFGPLVVFGMLAAGLGLMFGLFTRIALLGAVWLA